MVNVVEDDVRRVLADQEAAWNAGDADRYAACFHADGTFTNVFGDRYIGRDAFRARHAAIFNTFARGSKVSLIVSRVSLPVPGVAIVDVDCTLQTRAAAPTALPPSADGIVRTSLLEVLVKDEGEWRIAAYHNVDVKPLPVPQA
jgi:uncharacterized protein (TIGR02246 family)